MNKFCSFLIIIIIIYLTYDYCSNTIIEGANGGGRGGGYDESQDKFVKEATCSKQAVTSIKGSAASEPCQYKAVSCITKINDINEKDWGGNFTSYNKPSGSTDTQWNYKKQCKLCIQGSKVDGTTRNILANVGRTDDITIPDSHFAYDLCDAMVAGCESSIFYANGRQDGWSNDCANMKSASFTDNKLNVSLCKILQSDILQFFLGFMGGVECTMKIKALEFEAYMANKLKPLIKGFHEVQKGFHDVQKGVHRVESWAGLG